MRQEMTLEEQLVSNFTIRYYDAMLYDTMEDDVIRYSTICYDMI